jgi:hypothetical protein
LKGSPIEKARARKLYNEKIAKYNTVREIIAPQNNLENDTKNQLPNTEGESAGEESPVGNNEVGQGQEGNNPTEAQNENGNAKPLTELTEKEKAQKRIDFLTEAKSEQREALKNAKSKKERTRINKDIRRLNKEIAAQREIIEGKKAKKKTSIQAAIDEITPKNLYEATLLHLMNHGTLSADDYTRMSGFGRKDFGAAGFLLNNKSGKKFDKFEDEYYSQYRPEEWSAGYESDLEQIVNAIQDYIAVKGSKTKLLEQFTEKTEDEYLAEEHDELLDELEDAEEAAGITGNEEMGEDPPPNTARFIRFNNKRCAYGRKSYCRFKKLYYLCRT